MFILYLYVSRKNKKQPGGGGAFPLFLTACAIVECSNMLEYDDNDNS